MTPFLQLSLALVTFIAAAKLGGYLSYRIGQPSVLGELLVGVVLGPSVIDFLHLPFFNDSHLPEVIHQLAEIGVMFLMFIAGLELHLDEMLAAGKVSALSGSIGMFLPLGLGIGVGLIFGMSVEQGIFLGLTLAATSVSISAQTLLELNVLRSKVGFGLLGAAVFDDVLVVLGLSLFSAAMLSSEGISATAIGLILLRMAIFLLLAISIGLFALGRIGLWVDKLPISQGVISFAFITLLFYGWMAEQIGGMAVITGAFLAGLMMARNPLKEHIESGITTIAYSIFVPLFFINVGLAANVRAMKTEDLWLFIVMLLTAVLGKVLGAGLGAYLGGLNFLESLKIGIGMSSRGEVGLIVASVGIAEGFLPDNIFPAVVGVVILTTLITPPLLRLSYSWRKTSSSIET